MLKKVFLLTFLSLYLLKINGQSSINFFNNLSSYTPAFKAEGKFELDLYSNSWYNNLPSGIYSIGINSIYSNQKNLSFAGNSQSYRVGKSTSINQAQALVNYYSLINFKSQLTFGLGLKSITQKTDETSLLTDVNLSNFEYSYGSENTKTQTLFIPIGINLNNDKLTLGAYYNQAIGVLKSQYGMFAKALSFTTSVNNYPVKNYTGIAIHKEFINPKISLSNELVFDNYRIDLFGNYQLNKSISSLLLFGGAFHYSWKTFDTNYQIAVNNQKLGVSHQIGLKIKL